jgi:hypothetical protein
MRKSELFVEYILRELSLVLVVRVLKRGLVENTRAMVLGSAADRIKMSGCS